VSEEGKQMDMQEVMAIYEKLAAPGPMHQALAGSEGSWKTKVKTYMQPGQPPVESEGSAEHQMALGGRFLRQEFSAEMMGGQYEGLGFTGYDNHTGKFTSIWMDNMSTTIMVFEGTGSPDGKTVTMESPEYDDPVRGPLRWRSVSRVVDENNEFFEMYTIGSDGQEHKMMEIVYERK
jgi:hypothetical protein